MCAFSRKELLQAKYLLARMVLNCADSPALRCLCLCEPDFVLSDPDVFVDMVYDESTYRERWGPRKSISLGLHLRANYRCSMYSEHLYGAALTEYKLPTLASRWDPARAKVSRLDELLVWAESCADAHGIKPPYLGGPQVPLPVTEARAEVTHGDDAPDPADADDADTTDGYPDDDL